MATDWTPHRRARLLGYRAFGILCRFAGLDERLHEIADRHPEAFGGPCPQCAKAGELKRHDRWGDHPVCAIAYEVSVIECEMLLTIAEYGAELGVDEDGSNATAWAFATEDRWYTHHPDTVNGYFMEPSKDPDETARIRSPASAGGTRDQTRR